MEKNELFTIKPSLKQYYGRTVTKEMEFVQIQDKTFPMGEEVTVTSEIPGTGLEVHCFVWNTIEEMQPYSKDFIIK